MRSRNSLRIALLLCVPAALYGCTSATCWVGGQCLSDEENEIIEEWLVCEECTDELDRVLNEIGWRAIRRLAGALERPPQHRIARFERMLRVSHGRIGSPLPQADYVTAYRENYIAEYQKRAAIALGELARGGLGSGRAQSELQKALDEHEAGQRKYREDVLRTIHRTLQHATGSAGWVSLAAGTTHTCGLTASGDAYCWGSNDEGELGNGSLDDQNSPTRVSRFIAFASLSAGIGHHTCGIASSGFAHCWGSNANGEIGDGTTDPRLEPVPVASTFRLNSISVGGNHTCADSGNAGILCWGGNSFGQLGDSSLVSRTTPVSVRRGTTALNSVTTGAFHSCALDPSGATLCWGRNDDGQLGDGSTTDRVTPVPVSGPGVAYNSVSAGGFHTCATIPGGGVQCWGRNDDGQLGDGTQTMRSAPVPIAAPDTFTSITAGHAHTCGVTTSNRGYCWGANEVGQLGDGTQTTRTSPVLIAGGHRFGVLTAGDSHTCGVTLQSAIYCWGSGDRGQLGNAALTSSFVPVRVVEPAVP